MDFSQILNYLIDKRGGPTSYRIGKDTGISNRLIDYWRKGEKMPGAENLKKLANYFGVSTDYLLGKVEDGVSLNQILGIIAETYGISWEEASEINQILQLPEWQAKCEGLGRMDSFAKYFKEQKEKPAAQMDDELLAQLSADPVKREIAQWIAQLNSNDLQRVSKVLAAILEK